MWNHSCVSARLLVSSSLLFACATFLHTVASANPSGKQSDAVNRGDILLYGTQRKPSILHQLHAGPVSVKFQDGELRYLYVGNKEIVRRVYLAVRSELGDTAMPVITVTKMHDAGNSFHITFKADCKNEDADYSWNGEINGFSDGRITFKVDGAAKSNFESPRIGLNILYGSGALAGQPYQLLDDKGGITNHTFPVHVANGLLAGFDSFKTLIYSTSDGLTVSSGLDTQCIGMEDQRAYGDSSYKAFSSIPYIYPDVVCGESRSQTFTLEVKGVTTKTVAKSPIRVTVGQPIVGTRVPKIVPSCATSEDNFRTFNGDHEKYADAKLITIPFNPAFHMPDDDTFMENVPTVLDWVNSIRAFAPNAKFRFDPVSFNSPYPRPSADPRNDGLFAASWCSRVVKYLALGGVEEAAFVPVTNYAATALSRIAPYAGRRLLQVSIAPGTPTPVDALAIDGDGCTVIWLMNLTDKTQKVAIDGLRKPNSLRLTSISGKPYSHTNLSSLKLSPFEVLEIVAE